MDYQSLHMKTVADLRKLAKEQGVRVPAGTNKDTLIVLLLEADRASQGAKPAKEPTKQAEAKPAKEPAKKAEAKPAKEPAKQAEAKPVDKPATRRRGRPSKS